MRSQVTGEQISSEQALIDACVRHPYQHSSPTRSGISQRHWDRTTRNEWPSRFRVLEQGVVIDENAIFDTDAAQCRLIRSPEQTHVVGPPYISMTRNRTGLRPVRTGDWPVRFQSGSGKESISWGLEMDWFGPG